MHSSVSVSHSPNAKQSLLSFRAYARIVLSSSTTRCATPWPRTVNDKLGHMSKSKQRLNAILGGIQQWARMASLSIPLLVSSSAFLSVCLSVCSSSSSSCLSIFQAVSQRNNKENATQKIAENATQKMYLRFEGLLFILAHTLVSCCTLCTLLSTLCLYHLCIEVCYVPLHLSACCVTLCLFHLSHAEPLSSLARRAPAPYAAAWQRRHCSARTHAHYL